MPAPVLRPVVAAHISQQVGRLSSGSWKMISALLISEPLHPWTSRRRSSDSRKVTARLDKKTVPCRSALPATVLAGGSCSPTVMLNFGDASFKRRGEVRTVPRVPRGTRASCVLPRTSCTESARAAEPAGRAARRRSSTCAHHAPHAPLNPLADFRLLRRPTLLLLEEVIAAQCFRPPRCSARRPRRHARLRL